MCYGFNGPFGWGGMGLGMIMHVAIFALIVFLVFKLVKSCQKSHMTCCETNPSVEILKTRYAKGEITSEEYQKALKELK